MKKTLIFVIAIIVIGAAAYYFYQRTDTTKTGDDIAADIPEGSVPPPPQTTPPPPAQLEKKDEIVLGQTVQGRDITAYTFGEGDKEILFVGGIHGGYEWNTVLVAYELMDHLKTDPTKIPANVKVVVIPVMNPDGLYKTIGTVGRFAKSSVPAQKDVTIPGRYNANNVDLNRNFDCEWQAEAVWQETKVSGGSKAFSEPEAQAMKKYIEAHKPAAAVVFYSSYGGVFASNCKKGVLPETSAITKLYAEAAGYLSFQTYDFYKITGDMVNWFAKNDIPAISVLLSTHESTDWEKNRKGIEALLQHYGK